MRSHATRSCAALVAALLATSAAPADAQQTQQRAAPVPTAPATSAPPPAAAPQAAPAEKFGEIDGFRSAKFGMSEADVEKAIASDFKLSKDKIKRVPVPIEKTTTLIVENVELMENAGKSTIGYIFGFNSKKLFRVNIVWGGATDRQVQPQQILEAAETLRNFFVARNLPPERVAVNLRLQDGSIVFFQGQDAKGRQVQLRLFQQPVPPGEGQAVSRDGRTETRTALLLVYNENPEQPDIFQLKPGSF